jgi:hypothetical protein
MSATETYMPEVYAQRMRYWTAPLFEDVMIEQLEQDRCRNQFIAVHWLARLVGRLMNDPRFLLALRNVRGRLDLVAVHGGAVICPRHLAPTWSGAVQAVQQHLGPDWMDYDDLLKCSGIEEVALQTILATIAAGPMEVDTPAGPGEWHSMRFRRLQAG